MNINIKLEKISTIITMAVCLVFAGFNLLIFTSLFFTDLEDMECTMEDLNLYRGIIIFFLVAYIIMIFLSNKIRRNSVQDGVYKSKTKYYILLLCLLILSGFFSVALIGEFFKTERFIVSIIFIFLFGLLFVSFLLNLLIKNDSVENNDKTVDIYKDVK